MRAVGTQLPVCVVVADLSIQFNLALIVSPLIRSHLEAIRTKSAIDSSAIADLKSAPPLTPPGMIAWQALGLDFRPANLRARQAGT